MDSQGVWQYYITIRFHPHTAFPHASYLRVLSDQGDRHRDCHQGDRHHQADRHRDCDHGDRQRDCHHGDRHRDCHQGGGGIVTNPKKSPVPSGGSLHADY